MATPVIDGSAITGGNPGYYADNVHSVNAWVGGDL